MDLQDPLPESNWFWRRLFVFATMAVMLILLALIVLALGKALAAPQLADVAFWLICLIAWMVTVYTIAPSGEQVTKMVQSVKLAGLGVATKSTVTETETPVADASATKKETVTETKTQLAATLPPVNPIGE